MFKTAERFCVLCCAGWTVGDIARKLSADGIHVGVNLNGYTKGARNEIFALWPAPVQTSYMGFPATTGGGPAWQDAWSIVGSTLCTLSPSRKELSSRGHYARGDQVVTLA